MTPTWELSAALGLVASAAGWRMRRPVQRRSLYDESPLGISELDYARIQARRRLYRKTLWAVADAIAGTALGWLIAHYLLMRML